MPYKVSSTLQMLPMAIVGELKFQGWSKYQPNVSQCGRVREVLFKGPLSGCVRSTRLMSMNSMRIFFLKFLISFLAYFFFSPIQIFYEHEIKVEIEIFAIFTNKRINHFPCAIFTTRHKKCVGADSIKFVVYTIRYAIVPATKHF